MNEPYADLSPNDRLVIENLSERELQSQSETLESQKLGRGLTGPFTRHLLDVVMNYVWFGYPKAVHISIVLNGVSVLGWTKRAIGF